MNVRIRQVTLWRTEVRNEPGRVAAALEPLAHARTDLKVVMAQTRPGDPKRATIEIYPGSARKAKIAARAAGFSASPTPVLLVEGDNRPGLAYAIANTIAWAGINLSFFRAEVAGRRYLALLGFRTDADARASASLIRKVAARRAPGRAPARR